MRYTCCVWLAYCRVPQQTITPAPANRRSNSTAGPHLFRGKCREHQRRHQHNRHSSNSVGQHKGSSDVPRLHQKGCVFASCDGNTDVRAGVQLVVRGSECHTHMCSRVMNKEATCLQTNICETLKNVQHRHSPAPATMPPLTSYPCNTGLHICVEGC